MLLILTLLCLYVLCLFALTLAAVAYILRQFAQQLLERTLITRDHPDTKKDDFNAWGS